VIRRFVTHSVGLSLGMNTLVVCLDKALLGTSMLDLVEILLARNGIRNLRYDGRMNVRPPTIFLYNVLIHFSTGEGKRLYFVDIQKDGWSQGDPYKVNGLLAFSLS